MFKTQKGFTLVELLIVITVVSIMAASVISVTNPSRWFKQARDTKRKELVHTVATAMNVCYAQNGGSYDTPDNCVSFAELNSKGYLKVNYTGYSVPGEGQATDLTIGKDTGGNGCVSAQLEYPSGSNGFWKYTAVDDKTQAAATGC